MKPFPAFLVIIKTNYGRIIGTFVDSKFEITRGMEYEFNGCKYKDTKVINNCIIYYFLDDHLVKCTWKHDQKAFMRSDDEYFLRTLLINIQNNRNE